MPVPSDCTCSLCVPENNCPHCGSDNDSTCCYCEERLCCHETCDCGENTCDCGRCDECRNARCACECCGECECYPCECHSSGSGVLWPYDYTPDLVFHEIAGESTKTFYGMEIELTSNLSSVTTANAYLGSLGYLKEDSTVNGFEMVTHPMSYDYAMANFPWHMLSALEREGCYAQRDDNGIHVHVSRNGFSSPAHLYRWMKLFYRNETDITRIARRNCSWGKFSSSHKKGQFVHVTKGKGYRRPVAELPLPEPCGLCYDCRYGNECERIWWARNANNMRNDAPRDTTRQDRYSAINTTNTQTLEVRVFASTTKPIEAQSALQLVAASVEYTRTLTARVICESKGNAWGWDAFRAWFVASGKYSALAECDAISGIAFAE
jgi:hypothetical protein